MKPPQPGIPVEIDYRRATGDAVVYRQRLVDVRPEVVVTLMEATPLSGPKRIDGRVVLEPGSPVVWFTFVDAWHDIGAFHLADGTFTGWYANLLTPVELHRPTPERWRWSTTDLCLDLWLDAEGAQVLDRDELADALASGAVTAEMGGRAEAEAARLLDLVRNDEWPPAIVDEWPLERAQRIVGRATDQSSVSSSTR